MSTNMAPAIASQAASLLPIMVVFLTGMVLAIVFWSRHPMVSLMTALGFGLLLGNAVLGILFTAWIASSSGASGGAGRWQLMSLFAVFRSLTSAAAYGLLVTAIFGWRGKPDDKYGSEKIT